MGTKKAKARSTRPGTRASQAEVSDYLDGASDRFRATWPLLEKRLKRVFPNAEQVLEYGMPGWKIPLPEGAKPPSAGGTIPSGFVFVLFVDRKAGPVLHVWNPFDYYFLDKHKDHLAQHGLKTMRGCVQFARKGDYPIDAVEVLLKDVARQAGFL